VEFSDGSLWFPTLKELELFNDVSIRVKNHNVLFDKGHYKDKKDLSVSLSKVFGGIENEFVCKKGQE
jgi:hypothetical protein